ncbi:hypothetical protein B1222_19895 [Paenibacillus larvae subsp. pulvifaciens]|uniref:Uncharacterized protein n=1 Tax=Paenibacillus larvae subsp. pulvifaciens TaxID=1477 RepID=A0A1U9YQS8_9BACL|nr:hypothetical protein B1222_19895 [Paenibacillus larvae subsp. pulvifaciens]AQZ47786.1 hypothetical protein B5S25_15570 [Paenibacillus larvae subsp. pulvifaciens]ARF69549.1 hypothetical protein B7C51_19575 [Paenibacillus larvae subsp. pulvifaciens]MBH0341875.1 hypothetical protein [Paenibacillus larvae]
MIFFFIMSNAKSNYPDAEYFIERISIKTDGYFFEKEVAHFLFFRTYRIYNYGFLLIGDIIELR